MIIRLKPGVSLDHTHHQVFFAIGICAPILSQFGMPEVWLSAVNEAGHFTNPDPERQFHRLPDGTCQAFDIRTHEVVEKERLRRLMASLLGPSFDVILENRGEENEHIHTQFDPERPGTVL